MTGLTPNLERAELLEHTASRYTTVVAHPYSLQGFWKKAVLASPEVFEHAASRLAATFDLDDRSGAAELARALHIASAEANLKTGQPEAAVDKLDAIQFSRDRPLRQFRANVYRLAGRPAEAADLLGDEIGSLEDDPEEQNDLRLQRVTVHGAAGDTDAAREVYSKVATNHWEYRGLYESLSRYVGLGYLLASLDEGSTDETIRQFVPADLQPDALEEFPQEYRADMLRYLYRLHTTPASERKWLRTETEDTYTDSVWYQAALGLSVESPYDPEVFLDFVVGTGNASFEAWRRAEAARWRGDEEAAEAWMERLFASRERLDDTQSILLEALF